MSSEAEVVATVLALAKGEMDEADFAGWLKTNLRSSWHSDREGIKPSPTNPAKSIVGAGFNPRVYPRPS